MPTTPFKNAAALKAKHFVGTMRVPPGLIGFHPSNRGGQAPNGERCMSLLKTIIRDGYDAEEGDYAGILVQEKPLGNAVQLFNNTSLEGDPLLTPSLEGAAAVYGSLSHSHLNQCFKNVLGRLVLGVPEISDKEGRACMIACKEHDPAFAQACENGLRWTILSHDLNDEDRGCEIIQAWANSKNAVSVAHTEMELVSALSKWCSKSSAIAEKMTYENAKEAMMMEYPDMAQDEEFIQLFKLVIDLGADGAPFLAGLKAFTSKFVNPELRRARLVAFSGVAGLPANCPHLKVAVLKWTYKQAPKFGFCPVPDCNKLKSHPSVFLTEAEDALRHVHVGMASPIGELVAFEKTKWLSNVDDRVASVLLFAPSTSTLATIKEEMGTHLVAMFKILAHLLGQGGATVPRGEPQSARVMGMASKLMPWLVWPGDAAPSRVGGDAPRPRVLEFDATGAATSAQEELHKGDTAAEIVPVADWSLTTGVRKAYADACARSVAEAALLVVQGACYADKEKPLPVEVSRLPSEKPSVVATESLKKHQLLLPVGILNVGSLVSLANCKHPRAVRVTVTESTPSSAASTGSSAAKPPAGAVAKAPAMAGDSEQWPRVVAKTEFMVVPESSLPKAPEIAGTALEWKVTAYAHLFWLVPRDDDETKWNCELFHVDVTQANATKFEKSTVARAFNVSVPAMRNTRPIVKGEKIVLKWPKPPAPKAKPKAAATWQTEAARKRQKTSSGHSSTPPPR